HGFSSQLEDRLQGTLCSDGRERFMNVCTECRPLCAPYLQLLCSLQLRDVGGGTADCVRLTQVVPQEELNRYVAADLSVRRHHLFKLNWLARLDHLPIVGSHGFSDRVRMKVKIGLPANFLSSNTVSAFVFPVHEEVAKFQVFNEDDRGRVINNILQPLFTCAER